jgi:tRNA 2-thiocytidine biosynthesis protein TtcA
MKPAQNTRLFLHLKKWLEQAALDYDMIEENDRVLVAVSGGTDSLVLLDLLSTPMVHLPRFELLAVHVDHGFDPAYAGYEALQRFMRENGHACIMRKTDIGLVAHSPANGKKPCFLCSRLRRKEIFTIADEEGCNKIAFGHHRDDIIETLLINMFFAREISTMMPNQPIFNGKLNIIRPLAYLSEHLVKRYAHERGFPHIPNLCPTAPVSHRMYVKNLLRDLEKDNRHIRDNLFKAMSHVKLDYLPQKGNT